MRRQNPGEVPSVTEGAANSFAPLVASDIIEHVSWVAPQLYNDIVPFGHPELYVKSLQNDSKLEWNDKSITVNIPANKLVLGFPATAKAAPARDLPEWGKDPETLLKTMRGSTKLQSLKGVMTWSIGHDWSNGWRWVKAMKKIWDDPKRPGKKMWD